MILTLKFMNLDPMPRNRSHMVVVKGKRPMNIKTPLCREFELDVETRMEGFTHEIEFFNQFFNPKTNYISAEYYFFTPRDVLFNKQDTISSRATDTDAHKVFRDVIYRCIGLDDKLERDSRFFTPLSHDDKHNVIVILKLENMCNLENMFTLMQNTIEQTNEDLMSSALL